MREIEIKVNEQILNLDSDVNDLVENSANYIKLHFDFSEGWNDFLTKYAIFSNKHKKIKLLINNDVCYVPSEVIRIPSFSVSLLAENDTQRITTNVLYIPILKTLSLDGIKEVEELELLYKQIENYCTLENEELKKELLNFIDLLKQELAHIELDYTPILDKIDASKISILDDLLTIKNKIDTLDLDVDLTEVLAKIEEVETNISKINLNELNEKIDSIQQSIYELDVDVDFTPINTKLDKMISNNDNRLNTIDESLLNIKSTIENLNVDVDLTEVIGKLDELILDVSKVPTTDYSKTLLEIKNMINAIPDYSNNFSSVISKIDNIVIEDYTGRFDNIDKSIAALDELVKSINTNVDLTDVTNSLDAIKLSISKISTNDYTNTLLEIKTALSKIPTNVYDETLLSIINKIDNIVINDYTLRFDTIDGEVENIKTLISNITSKLDKLILNVSNIPTTEYSEILLEIKNLILDIPNYSENFTTIINKIDDIVIKDYTVRFDNIDKSIITLDELVKSINTDVDLTEVTNSLDAIKLSVSKISTNDYTNTLLEIKGAISKIPTNVYDKTLLSIINKIDNIVIEDYTNRFNSIDGEITNIKTLISSLDLDVDFTPINTKLDNMNTLISKVPTVTYTNDLLEIKNGISKNEETLESIKSMISATLEVSENILS